MSLWDGPSSWHAPVTLCSLLQRLKDYQRRLDLSHLKQSSDPMLSEFKVTPLALAPSPTAQRFSDNTPKEPERPLSFDPFPLPPSGHPDP